MTNNQPTSPTVACPLPIVSKANERGKGARRAGKGLLIELIRTNETKWGVDGMLRVKGKKFCDTVEHPTKHKPKGRYEVTLADNPFRHGDGPMLLNFGEIIVGENACPGLVIHSAAAYATLYDRLKKEWERGNEVVLKIR